MLFEYRMGYSGFRALVARPSLDDRGTYDSIVLSSTNSNPEMQLTMPAMPPISRRMSFTLSCRCLREDGP